MKKMFLLLILVLSLVLSTFGTSYAGCREEGRWEGVGIALGATTLLNTILYGIPSPVVPPAVTGYYRTTAPVYYRAPVVVHHYNCYRHYVPWVNVWINDFPSYCPPRPCTRIYNYHYNYYYRHHHHHHHHHGWNRGYHGYHRRSCYPYRSYYGPTAYRRY